MLWKSIVGNRGSGLGSGLTSVNGGGRHRAVCLLSMIMVSGLLIAVVAVSIVVGVLLISVVALMLTAAIPMAAAVSCLHVSAADGEAEDSDQHASQRKQVHRGNAC